MGEKVTVFFIFSSFLILFCMIAYASLWTCQKLLSQTKKKELQSFLYLSHAIQASVIALLSANLISTLLTQNADFKRALSKESSYLRTLLIMGETGTQETQIATREFTNRYIKTVMDNEFKKEKNKEQRKQGRLIIENFYRWIYKKQASEAGSGWKKGLYDNMSKELNSLCHTRNNRIILGQAKVPSFIMICLGICAFFLLIGMGFYIKKMHILYDVSLIICCASLSIISTVMYQLKDDLNKNPPLHIIQDVIDNTHTT